MRSRHEKTRSRVNVVKCDDALGADWDTARAVSLPVCWLAARGSLDPNCCSHRWCWLSIEKYSLLAETGSVVRYRRFLVCTWPAGASLLACLPADITHLSPGPLRLTSPSLTSRQFAKVRSALSPTAFTRVSRRHVLKSRALLQRYFLASWIFTAHGLLPLPLGLARCPKHRFHPLPAATSNLHTPPRLPTAHPSSTTPHFARN